MNGAQQFAVGEHRRCQYQVDVIGGERLAQLVGAACQHAGVGLPSTELGMAQYPLLIQYDTSGVFRTYDKPK